MLLRFNASPIQPMGKIIVGFIIEAQRSKGRIPKRSNVFIGLMARILQGLRLAKINDLIFG
jgi:rRNA pseudouridine-1189 N-methylase Emg1 (Nep1/Mra1 family)